VAKHYDYEMFSYTRLSMSHVLLAGKDWTARTLLRAQLIEEGLDVEAYESIRAAAARLQASGAMPGLLVADLSQSENPADDVSRLSQWSKLVPIWVMAGHGLVAAEALESQGFEKVLFRPLDMGKLVQQIKQRLARNCSGDL
jgi:DNA-binding NtrC family response regulator